jgi:membrane protease YdiL (CAAX protease family)
MSVEPAAPAPAGSIRSRIAAHPVAAFLVLAIPLAWLAQFLAILLLQDVTPGLLVELIVLLGVAVLVTAAAEGRAGVVQRRLMDRKGVLAGSLLTAIPFALIHLPQAFAERGFAATPWADVALSWGVLFGFALVARCLLGMAYVATGGSILILGLLHGSMNASQSMDTVDWWQFIPAVVVLTAAIAAFTAVRSRTTGQGSSGHALRRRRIRPVWPANP